jgi:hypothetical protein
MSLIRPIIAKQLTLHNNMNNIKLKKRQDITSLVKLDRIYS